MYRSIESERERRNEDVRRCIELRRTRASCRVARSSSTILLEHLNVVPVTRARRYDARVPRLRARAGEAAHTVPSRYDGADDRRRAPYRGLRAPVQAPARDLWRPRAL